MARRSTTLRTRAAARLERVLAAQRVRLRPRSSKLPLAQAFIARLNERLRGLGLDADAVMGGSSAKGTNLDMHDIDVFVRFAPSRAPANLSDALARALPKDAKRVHGSRDYFQLARGALAYELVPVLRVDDPKDARNVTDVSPLHVAYVQARLRERPGLADDVRLAKQFCKALKIYGAESYINGVSGHVLELLVLHSGGFAPLLRAAASWRPPVVIDPARHYADAATAAAAIDRAKHGPLLLVDPVQPERNAAAALSLERFLRLVDGARAFLAKPSPAAFAFVPLTPERILRAHRGGELFILRSRPLPGSQDVAATKLLKAHEHLVDEARRLDFDVRAQGWEFADGAATHYFVFARGALGADVEREGPPIRVQRDAARFLERHPRAFERDGRLYARVPRQHRTAASFLRAAIRSPYVKDRCRSVRIVRARR